MLEAKAAQSDATPAMVPASLFSVLHLGSSTLSSGTRMKRTFAAAALLLGSVGSLQAQQAPALVGKWNIEYEAGRRVEAGGQTAIMGKGVLTIAQEGDSLVAKMEAGPRPDGTPTPPATFKGKLTSSGAVFVSKRDGHMSINGEDKAITVTTTWNIQANGDDLTGTMVRQLPPELSSMAGPSEPSPVKGSRAKV